MKGQWEIKVSIQTGYIWLMWRNAGGEQDRTAEIEQHKEMWFAFNKK